MARTATIYRDRSARRWRYRVTAANGEIIDSSQGYTRRASALRACRRNRIDVRTIRVQDRFGLLERVIEVE